MPSRLVRNTVVLWKSEVTYATDSIPTGAANAMLLSELKTATVEREFVPRNLILPYLGASEELPGAAYVMLDFEVEAVGSGAAGTAPPWAPAARGSGLAQTLAATFRADYTPISTGFESGSMYWYDDGVLQKAVGVRGNPSLRIPVGGLPKLGFRFLGLRVPLEAQAVPTAVITAWQQPQVVIDANTGDLTIGGTHATGSVAPAITGGTTYPSQGIEIDLGNQVDFTALLGGETVDITDRKTSGKVVLDLTAAQEVALVAAMDAGTLMTMGLQHGTVAGNKIMAWLPAVQLKNHRKESVKGKRMVGFDFVARPVAGNDEFRLITSF